eukprot:scaffold100605_cov73-Phaeocystis_antarctica.AAC.1
MFGVVSREHLALFGQCEHSSRTGRVYFVSAAVCTSGGRECGHSRGVGPPKSIKKGGKIANGDFENLYKLQIRNPRRIPWGKCAFQRERVDAHLRPNPAHPRKNRPLAS